MFENVLPENGLELIDNISSKLNDFYLAGGTDLALQLGHRKSIDLDFFSPTLFNTDIVLENIQPDKTLLVRTGAIHCELKKVKLSFLFYPLPLTYPTILWRGLNLADWKDITAEKFKAISQRGTKKDFYDLYAVLQIKLSIDDACQIFKARFASSGINMYHVLKSLTFFEDAEEDPLPILTAESKHWQWDVIKKFFEGNIKQFEKNLME
ncbi:MAG: nucleotidyl transferase AbiEii/AbiGii toxin family protein [bacterium]